MKNYTDCDVLILCGGLGTRLKSVVSDAPKVMAKIGGDPFLDVQIKALAKKGFKRIILCTGYLAEMIEEYYRKNTFGLEIDFSTEKEPLGTGGAIKNAKPLVKSNVCFAINGDCYCDTDYKSFFDFHIQKKAKASLLVSKVEGSKDYGGIALDKDFHILKFLEKQSASQEQYVNVGVYCFNKEVFDMMPSQNKFSIEYDFFPKMVGHDFYGQVVQKEFLDIGTPERYKKAQEELKD